MAGEIEAATARIAALRARLDALGDDVDRAWLELSAGGRRAGFDHLGNAACWLDEARGQLDAALAALAAQGGAGDGEH